MKNLTPYNEESYTFHKEIVKSKKNKSEDSEFKNRINALDNIIENQFLVYKKNFELNTLEEITAISLTVEDKKDLLNLYSYKNKILQKLKNYLTTDKNNRIDNTCQNCTIGEINSFDHYLPQSEFAEFIVNPLNLVPCCSKCNGLKSSFWLSKSSRIYLNNYLDILPNEQYLFVEIKIIGQNIDLKYFLKNETGIEDKLFNLINNHYIKLNLFQRFKENSDSIISELEITVKGYLTALSIDQIQKIVIEECKDNFIRLGRNHWRYVLKMTLIMNEEFLNRF